MFVTSVRQHFLQADHFVALVPCPDSCQLIRSVSPTLQSSVEKKKEKKKKKIFVLK